MAHSRSSSYSRAAAVSTATPVAPWTAVAETEAADCLPQNLSIGSGLFPAILESQVAAARDG